MSQVLTTAEAAQRDSSAEDIWLFPGVPGAVRVHAGLSLAPTPSCSEKRFSGTTPLMAQAEAPGEPRGRTPLALSVAFIKCLLCAKEKSNHQVTASGTHNVIRFTQEDHFFSAGLTVKMGSDIYATLSI